MTCRQSLGRVAIKKVAIGLSCLTIVYRGYPRDRRNQRSITNPGGLNFTHRLGWATMDSREFGRIQAGPSSFNSSRALTRGGQPAKLRIEAFLISRGQGGR